MELVNGECAIDYPTVLLIHGDTARPILDYSRNRETLTNTNNAMSSTITPKFGAGQSIYSPTNGYTSWAAKVVSADYTKPMTIEFWVYLGSAPAGSLNFAGEVVSAASPQNGDWTFFWTNGTGFRFWRWIGTTFTLVHAELGPTTLTTGWHHVFAQTNSGTSISVGYDGTIYNNAGVSSISIQPNAAAFAFGGANPAKYGPVVSAIDQYFQELRITDGVARFPATGTYPLPQRQS